MNEKINITKMDGTNVTADIICFIENTTTTKRYVYYTLNEIVGAGPNSTVKIYVSKIQQGNPALDAPISEDDWNALKGYMGDSLKGTANAEVKYIPLAELDNPVSVSERAIAMPTSYDYINKQRGLYAQSIATAEATVEVAPQASTEPATPAPTEEPTPATSEPVQMESPAPAAMPTVETPVSEAPIAPEPTPVVEPTPVAQPVMTPVEEPVLVTDEETSSAEDGTTGDAIKLEPIDLASIEAKYAEMVEEINRLKEKELEAAKRYNATIELSAMHSEQHANYVQNDLKESLAAQEMAPISSDVTPTPVEAPAIETPVTEASPTPEVAPTMTAVEPSPIAAPNPAPTIEPTPVTPVVPEPAPAMSAQDLETNWFDMPNNQ